MKVYQVKKKVTQTKSGVLGVPEAMMGVKPAYIYRDEAGEFFLSLQPPEVLEGGNIVWKYDRSGRCLVPLRSYSPRESCEYIVTIWPRDEQHMLARFWEVVRWHEQVSNV